MTEPIEEFTGGYRFLSNFYPVDGGVLMNGIKYKTVEHAFQASKTVDSVQRKVIARFPKAGQAKRYGRTRVTLREDWESVKDRLMLELVRQKFKNPELKKKLLDTGDAELIEGNDWGDTYWGKFAGVGQNKLGKILMKVRKELKG